MAQEIALIRTAALVVGVFAAAFLNLSVPRPANATTVAGVTLSGPASFTIPEATPIPFPQIDYTLTNNSGGNILFTSGSTTRAFFVPVPGTTTVGDSTDILSSLGTLGPSGFVTNSCFYWLPFHRAKRG